MNLNRREFLATAGKAAAAVTVGRHLGHSALSPETTPGTFDFVFFTDTHIEPELDAAHGCEMCYQKMNGIKSDFAIMGGDHVFDALAVDGNASKLLFDLYQKTEQTLQQKVYQVIGNHDLFGILDKSGVLTTDPLYGKKMYEDRFGAKTYYSFDHKGYHFIVLDSVQPTPDRQWQSLIDDAQLEWLEQDLQKTGTTVPVIINTHVPMVTGFPTFAEPGMLPPQKYDTISLWNTWKIIPILDKYNVIAVLQGHTHINERIFYHNRQFITSGAVCGNWWRGPRLGTPRDLRS